MTNAARISIALLALVLGTGFTSERVTYQNVPISDDGKLKVDADVFTHLLSDMLKAQIKTNQFLQVIAGFPLLDTLKD